MRWIMVVGLIFMCGACFGQSITVDDFGPGFRLEGVWADSAANNYSGGGTIGNRFHYTSKYAPFAKTGKEKAFWTPNLKKAGKYKVEVSFRATLNRSKKVTYEVHSREGVSKKAVDQSQGDNMTWEDLGEFDFETGESGFVACVSDGGGSASIDAARFTFVGESGTPVGQGSSKEGGMEDILGIGQSKAKTIRLDKKSHETRSYTFETDGTAHISALLATYKPATMKVVIKKADGSEVDWLEWKRENDRDSSPAKVEGQDVAESMFEQQPGDFSAREFSREIPAKKGDTFILSLEGSFGKGEPFLTFSTGPSK